MHTECCPLGDFDLNSNRNGGYSVSVGALASTQSRTTSVPMAKNYTGLTVYYWFQVPPGAAAGTVQVNPTQQTPPDFQPSAEAVVLSDGKSVSASEIAAGGVFCVTFDVPRAGFTGLMVSNTTGVAIEQSHFVITRRAIPTITLEACKCNTRK